MHLNKISFFVFFFILNLLSSVISAQVITDQEVRNLSERVKSVEKVEQLYSIRYAVGKYANLKNMSLAQQVELMNAMKLLSDEFEMRSHFRNAADVYKDYLDYNLNYLVRYNAFVKDSLSAVHKKIESDENAQIVSLDSEIAALSKTRAAVSGLKTQYYSLGGFSAVAIIILTIVIGISRNRAIQQAQQQIQSNRESLIAMNRQSADTGLFQGAIAYSRETARVNAETLQAVIASIQLPEEKKIFQKEIVVLKQAQQKFEAIAL